MQDEGTKRCTQCGETKPRADYYRGKSECKRCSIERTKRWVAAHPDQVKATRAKNAEAIKASQRHAWKKRKDDPALKAAARARSQAWREANRERHRRYSKQWAADNPARARETYLKWYAANREQVQARNRQWREENYERHLVTNREDARKRYLSRDEDAWAYSLVLRRDPCSYCGGPAGAVDHITSLSAGGANEWDNLTAACIPCNSSKRSKSLLTFLENSLAIPTDRRRAAG